MTSKAGRLGHRLGIDHRGFLTAHEVYRRLGGQS